MHSTPTWQPSCAAPKISVHRTASSRFSALLSLPCVAPRFASFSFRFVSFVRSLRFALHESCLLLLFTIAIALTINANRMRQRTQTRNVFIPTTLFIMHTHEKHTCTRTSVHIKICTHVTPDMFCAWCTANSEPEFRVPDTPVRRTVALLRKTPHLHVQTRVRNAIIAPLAHVVCSKKGETF